MKNFQKYKEVFKTLMMLLHKKTAMFASIMLVSFFVSQIWADEFGDRLAERFMNNVVQLTVTFSNEKVQDGFGFVVGEQGNKLYVVTANHVIYSDDPDVKTKEVLVKFYEDQVGKPVSGEPLNVSSSLLDAALLRVTKPEHYRWERKVLCPGYKKGDMAWFIGQGGKWNVPPDGAAGHLKDDEPNWDGSIDFYITSVKPGTSGAPLFTKDGFIGMITKDRYLEARAVHIDSIRKLIKKECRICPWDLQLHGGQVVSEPVRSGKRPVKEKEPKKDVKPKIKPVHVAQAKPGKPSAGDVWKEPVTGMEFVWVPGGSYQMGCGSWAGDCDSDEKPAHEVYVDGFWMGKYEVTQGQWKQIMGNNPSGFKKGDRYPVESVSWNDAKKFLVKLNAEKQGKYEFRLPTEAEWEYACRSGGKEEKYAGFSDDNKLEQYVNFCDKNCVYEFRKEEQNDKHKYTSPVGKYEPNALGLHDMSGNVQEWCEDSYRGGA